MQPAALLIRTACHVWPAGVPEGGGHAPTVFAGVLLSSALSMAPAVLAAGTQPTDTVLARAIPGVSVISANESDSGLGAEEPVSVGVAAAANEDGARVILTFSRRVEYRLEESRGRLRLLLREAVAESSEIDQDVDGDVLKRIRVNATSRGSEVVLYLGRAFGSFTTNQREQPFRLSIQLAREGVVPKPSDWEGSSGGAAGEGGALDAGATGAIGGGPRAPRGRTVVVDAGHGGAEEGAVSQSGLKEKDLALDIARRLRTHLEGSGFAVVLTRDEDEAIDLTGRTAMANRANAGAFISIHANSSGRPGAYGAETYFLSYSPSGDDQAMSLARKENLAAFGGREGAGGPPGEIDLVLWEMAQTEYLSASSRLAEMIQAGMNALGGLRDRGVKQAPFRVLVGATMPAVLVEVGFLSNADEERKLATTSYRDEIARALADAVQQFARTRESEEGGSAWPPAGGAPR